MNTRELMRKAASLRIVIPGFNIPYLPMMAPVVRALRDCDAFGLVMVARLEWEKFESGSLEAVRDEYAKHQLPRHTRLHLDHVPVIDEDDLRVDYVAIIRRAVAAGYESVMVDGSRLPFAENVACTREIVQLAHAAGVPVEAELGAVMGHEAGPLPPYDELFASGKGFTDPDEAAEFVRLTEVDWLSVAVGNIHGAISAAARSKTKIQARLSVARLQAIRQRTDVPLVLHGGTGIRKQDVLAAVCAGIAKINVATAIRQPYEASLKDGVTVAQEAVYQAMLVILNDDLELHGSAKQLQSRMT